MVKKYDCPLCNGGKLDIDISNGYKVVFSGKMSELPCRVFCKNCNRFVKYIVVKDDNKK